MNKSPDISGFFYALFLVYLTDYSIQNIFKMKKFYISICALVISFSSIAQVLNLENIESDQQFNEKEAFYQEPNVMSNTSSAVPIWSEDFGNGFPANWTTSTTNTSGGNAICNWVWSDDGSWGNFSGGGTSSADAAINSTTANNGFLISDIDSANHFVNGQPSGSNYEYIDSYFITEAISTLGFPNVTLEFEHNFRFNNDIDLVISVSDDSISWTDFFVQGSATNNEESADPEVLNLNISCVAGNQSNVYIKVGWSARVYYWMIDDMKLIETSNHVLSLEESNYGGWFTTPTTNDFGLDYSFYPLNQATANPYTFEGVITNLGGQAQTTHLNIDVKDGNGTSVFTDVSNDSILNPQDAACNFDEKVFLGNAGFTPPAVGVYQFNIWGSSDSTATDTVVLESVVTDDIYGRDNNIQYSDYGLGRTCGGLIIGTYYDVFVADNIKSISVYIDDESVAGAEIYIAIYEVDGNNNKIFLEQSSDYTLQTNDIDGWIEVSFDSPIALTANTYMAAVGGYAHPFDTSMVAMSKTARPTTCYIQKNGCLNSGQSAGDWYWLSRVPMIRMNMGAASSINENYFNGFLEVYPNPSNGKITLEMNEVATDKYNVTLNNLLGQTVYTIEKDINGFFIEDIDITKFGKGTYLITISNSSSIITEKLIVE